jgi:ketosteroid isomerase-like protein
MSQQSQENVEIVRRAVDAWNRRDIEDLHALGDPEGEYVTPDAGTTFRRPSKPPGCASRRCRREAHA